jgi:hypothetical protein
MFQRSTRRSGISKLVLLEKATLQRADQITTACSISIFYNKELKMSTIIDLVPPAELCQLIPQGDFFDASHAWILSDVSGFVCKTSECEQVSGKEWSVIRSNASRIIRAKNRGETICPAPTLQEIIDKLDKDNAYNDLMMTFSDIGGWHIYYIGNRKRHCYDRRAVVAALKLYLQEKGEYHD